MDEIQKPVVETPPVETPTATPPVETPPENWEVKYLELEAKNRDMEARLAQSPYPNPFVEKIALLYKEGKPQEEVNNFIRFQTMNVDTLTPEQAIKEKMRMQYPPSQFTDDDIHVLFLSKFPEVDEDNEVAKRARELAIRGEGNAAKADLVKQKVDMENAIKPQVEDPQEAARRASYQAQWGSVAQTVASTPFPLSFSLEDDQKIGGKYEFKYDPKVDPETSKQIAQVLSNYAVQAGLELNQEGLENLKQQYANLLWMNHREDYLKAMAMDMYAQLSDFFSKKYSGIVPRGSQITQPPKQQQRPAAKNPAAPGML